MNTKILVIVGVSVLSVVALVVAGWFLDPTTRTAPTPSRRMPNGGRGARPPSENFQIFRFYPCRQQGGGYIMAAFTMR